MAMKNYVKPVVLVNEELAEGVYAASGVYSDETGSTVDGPGCDSVYMRGVWQAPDYSAWGPEGRGYKQQFGCLGCPANTDSGCGLQTHYVESGYASSYDVDNGNRMPSWERKGYGPDDEVSDWVM